MKQMTAEDPSQLFVSVFFYTMNFLCDRTLFCVVMILQIISASVFMNMLVM